MASVNMEKEGLLKQLEFFKEKGTIMYIKTQKLSGTPFNFLCSIILCYILNLHGTGIKIRSLVSDRHPSIRKHMVMHEPGIDHFFDIWHISKGKQSE